MSKPLPKQTAQKPVQRAIKPAASSEAKSLATESMIEQSSRQDQVNGLPNHPTSQRIRHASILRMQRRQGNSHVQRVLRRERLAASRDNGRQRPLLPSSSLPLLQLQVEDEESPSPEQKAAAEATAQAAEGSAGQAAAQAQQAASGSQAAASQERQAGQNAAPEATLGQIGGPVGNLPVGQSGPGASLPETSQQQSQAISGEQSTGQEAGASPGPGATGEQAPTSPQEDEGFLAIIEQIRQKAGQQKSHPQASQKAEEAQGAAESPAAETESKAKAGHVQELQSTEAPLVDKGGLKAQLMQKIQALAPRTAGEADQLKSSNKLGGLKAELKGKMAEEKSKATEPMKKKSEAAPSQAGISPKPVTPLPPPKPPSPLPQFNAELAAPKSKPKSQIEKPLKEQSKSLDEEMSEADITEEQLKKSNEPEFQSALEAKKEAQQNAAEAPQNYRKQEQEQISQAREEASGSANEELQGMQDFRQQLLGEVGQRQGHAKSSDEKKRQEVAAAINAIYDNTKSTVDSILSGLDARVNPVFEAGAAAARAAFENFVAAKMEAYKQRRYGGLLGWARWAKDKLLGMPAEVNQFYALGRQRYISQMDAVLDNVVAIIGSAIQEAKQAVARGKFQIQEYVSQLPADLQQVGQEAALEIQDRFDQLEQGIESKQQELVDSLAQRYQANLEAIDACIEAMQAQHQGLLQSAANAIRGVIQTIGSLTQRLTSILSRAVTAVKDIMRDPVGFLGNLLGAVRTGLMSFVGNIATHLRRGLMDWLFEALDDAGIELPESFDSRGILSVVMQVLGVTWEAIRARAANIFGERVVGVLEKVFGVFQTIKSEGLGGLFRFVKDKVVGIKDTIMDAVRELLTTEVFQAGIQKIISLLGGPAGAFISAVESIYNVISWFISNGQQVASLVGAIMGSVKAIVGGAISQASGLIEQALARSIPTAISFLAKLLGLGGLGRKIRQIIERVRAPVNRVVDWILNKARGVVSGLGDQLGGGGSAAEAE